LAKIGPKIFGKFFFTALLHMVWGVAGLRTNFFSSGLIFSTGLAQESWWDLAAVSQLPQSGISIPASRFSPVPLVAD
jgi:hypothetical protein